MSGETAFAAAAIAYLAVMYGLANLLLFLPAYWCFKRAGWSGWWFLPLSLPGIGLIVLWAFAFGRWPAEPGDVEG